MKVCNHLIRTYWKSCSTIREYRNLHYYVSSEKLKQDLNTFLNAYHFAKRLKTLKGLTPYEFIKDYWTQKPEAFKLKPTHLNLKPYS